MTSKTEVDYNKTAGCSSLLLLLPCPRPAAAPSSPPLHHFTLQRLASRQHSLFVHWAAKNFTLTLLSGHQAVCAYFPIPLLQLAPLPTTAVAVAAAAAAATTKAKFRFGLFWKFTVDSEDSLEERAR